MYIPKQIQEIVKDLKYSNDDIGRSEDVIICYEDKYILKISNNNTLYKEKELNDWITNYLPGPKSICFIEENNKYYYLRTAIKGKSLIDEGILNNPMLLVNILVEVINKLKSLDNKNCPFNSNTIGKEFIHGDLCLPNIYVDENNNFIGFIDLGNAGKGDRWCDYAWLLWSLEYNLHTNIYNKVLLDRINISFNKEKYEKYIQ